MARFVVLNGMVRSIEDALDFVRSFNGGDTRVSLMAPEKPVHPLKNAPKPLARRPYQSYELVEYKGCVMTKEDYLEMRRNGE
jgi:hypothetical protein